MDRESPTRRYLLPILRLKAGSDATVRLLSADWIRLPTHFARSTVLCTGQQDCPLCELLPTRWYWYLPAIAVQTKAVVLLELSAKASADLEQAAGLFGSGFHAGARFQLIRRGAKSPVRVEWTGQDDPGKGMMLHEWVTPLMHVFGLPPINPGEQLEAYADRVHRPLHKRAEALAARLAAAPRR